MNRHLLPTTIIDVEERFEHLVKHVFEAYNFISFTPLNTIKDYDLLKLQQIVNILRNYHCALLHNEKASNTNTSRRASFEDLVFMIITKMRTHSKDWQGNKVNYDFTHIHQKMQIITDTTINLIQIIQSMNLKQNFFARVQFYYLHLKALSLHCALLHTQYMHPYSRRRTDIEPLFLELHKRVYDLGMSFKDKPHPLHIAKEPRPHPPFTDLL